MAGFQEIGTNHFVSRLAADQYYRSMGYDNADDLVEDGTIAIGPPALNANETLRIDQSEGRYLKRFEISPDLQKPTTSTSLQAEAAWLSVTDNRIVLPAQHLQQYAEIKRLIETSGGKYSSKGYFTFPAGIDATEVLAAVRQGQPLNGKKASQSFFTPEDLAYEVCQAAGPLHGKRLLEPSAGDGALADIARAAGAKVVVVENHRPNVLVLQQKGYDVWDQDFLTLTPSDIGYFDVVVANPPFSGNQDIEHVMHMFNFLKSGGVMSVITSQRWRSGSHRSHLAFRQFLETQGALVTEVEAGAFRESGTMVPTLRIVLTRQSAPVCGEQISLGAPLERGTGSRQTSRLHDQGQLSLAI